MAPSIAANFWLREPSSESMAPALMRLSMARRLTAERSTRSQKSWRDENGETGARRRESGAAGAGEGSDSFPPVRPLMMASTADWPRFLTAPRPKRMASVPSGVRSGVKLQSLARSEEHTSELQSRFDL